MTPTLYLNTEFLQDIPIGTTVRIDAKMEKTERGKVYLKCTVTNNLSARVKLITYAVANALFYKAPEVVEALSFEKTVKLFGPDSPFSDEERETIMKKYAPKL
jgi:hypothetical protein